MFRVPIFLLILLSLALTGANAFALSKSLDELVSENEIIMPDLALRYPDAEAVIILDHKEVEQSRIINPVYITRHVAIKIMKESAIEKLRTVKIPYYREVKITDMNAQTINDGQTIKVRDIPSRDVDLEGADRDFIIPLEQGNNCYMLRPTELATSSTSTDLLKLSDNPVFHKKKEDVWRIRQIDFPEVRVGSVLEYEYKIEDKRLVLYDYFYFQREYPVLKVRYVARNTKMTRFNYQMNNFVRKPQWVLGDSIDNVEDHQNMRVRNGLRTVDLNDSDSWQFYGYEYFEIAMDTMKAHPKEVSFAPAFENLTPRLDMIMREAINLIKRSDIDFWVRHINFSPNWNFAIHRMTQNSLVDERQSRMAKEKIGELIAAVNTPEEKITAAIAWVRENIKDTGELKRWDSYFWMAQPEAPDNVLRNGSGNADDITHFLVSALSLNDLWVSPAYGRSRSRGTLMNDVPMETQFDVSLLALEVSSRRFKFWQLSADIPLPPGYIDYDLENITVFINQSGEDDITFQNAMVPDTDPEQNAYQLNGSLALDADGSATGKLEQKMTGHFNARLRRDLLGAEEAQRAQAWSSWLLGTFDQAQVNGPLQIDGLDQVSDNISVNAEVSLSGLCSQTAEGLVMKAAVITDEYSSKLSGEEREYGVMLPHTVDYKTSLEITVPAGYTLPDSLPGPVELKTRGFYYNRIVAKQGPNTLLIKRDFSMGNLETPVISYNRRFASLLQQVHKADNLELVLKKL